MAGVEACALPPGPDLDRHVHRVAQGEHQPHHKKQVGPVLAGMLCQGVDLPGAALSNAGNFAQHHCAQGFEPKVATQTGNEQEADGPDRWFGELIVLVAQALVEQLLSVPVKDVSDQEHQGVIDEGQHVVESW